MFDNKFFDLRFDTSVGFFRYNPFLDLFWYQITITDPDSEFPDISYWYVTKLEDMPYFSSRVGEFRLAKALGSINRPVTAPQMDLTWKCGVYLLPISVYGYTLTLLQGISNVGPLSKTWELGEGSTDHYLVFKAVAPNDQEDIIMTFVPPVKGYIQRVTYDGSSYNRTDFYDPFGGQEGPALEIVNYRNGYFKTKILTPVYGGII